MCICIYIYKHIHGTDGAKRSWRGQRTSNEITTPFVRQLRHIFMNNIIKRIRQIAIHFGNKGTLQVFFQEKKLFYSYKKRFQIKIN